MKLKNLLIIAGLILASIAAIAWTRSNDKQLAGISPAEGKEAAGSHEEKGHEEGEHGEESGREEQKATAISAEAAKTAGIETEVAGVSTIKESLPLSGKIILNPDAEAEIKARFPGIVKSVRRAIGDKVSKGETLATVESNDSLQTYPVISPLAGTVINRTINTGDTAAEEPIFVVADLDRLMAELHIFSRDIDRVRVGQVVRIQSMDGTLADDGTIKSLLPTTDVDTQTTRAIIQFSASGNAWRPGMAVQGGAVVNEQEVALAVKNTALQTMDGKTTLFVQEGEKYEPRPVTLGRSDGTQTEVISGLKEGETYVTKGSFVVKADIEKSGAEHAH